MGDGERMNEWKNEPKGRTRWTFPFFSFSSSSLFRLFFYCFLHVGVITFGLLGGEEGRGRHRTLFISILFYWIQVYSILFDSKHHNKFLSTSSTMLSPSSLCLTPSCLLSIGFACLLAFLNKTISSWPSGQTDLLPGNYSAGATSNNNAGLPWCNGAYPFSPAPLLSYARFLSLFSASTSFFCCLSFCRCKGTTDGGCKNKDMSSIGERISCSIRNIRSMCLRIDSPRKNSRRSLAMSMSDGMFGSRNTMNSMHLQVGGKWLAYAVCLSSYTRIPSS